MLTVAVLGRPRSTVVPASQPDKDGPLWARLVAEGDPPDVHAYLVSIAGNAAPELELSHSEQKRIEAELWRAEHGGSGRMLKAFRGNRELTGCLVFARRKFQSATSLEEAAHWRQMVLSVKAEIKRRAGGGRRIPLTAPEAGGRRAAGKSPGAPTKASKIITLRRRGA